MKVLALVSGGKDSCYNMLLCQRHSHEIVALGNLLPAAAGVDELDSYMFQTVGHNVIPLYAECMGVPLYRRHISGSSVYQNLSYQQTQSDEVEDMLQLVAHVKQCHPDTEAVSSGAIASDYQRLRVEHVCARLGLVSLAYMWHQPQAALLRGMISSGIEAILIKVAALGLVPERHLGKTLQEMEPHLHKICRLYGCNICGEGGEYETLVLDCPLFSRARIVLDAWEDEHLSAGDVAILRPTAFHTEPKTPPAASTLAETALQSQANRAQVHFVHDQPMDKQEQLSDSIEQQRQMPASSQSPSSHTEPEEAAGTSGHADSVPHDSASQAKVHSKHQQPTGQQEQSERSADRDKQTLYDATQRKSNVAQVRTVQDQPTEQQEQSSSRTEQQAKAQLPPFHVEASVRRSERALSMSCAPRSVGNTDGTAASDLAEAALDAALAEISQGLDQQGVSLADAVFVQLYLADMGSFAAANTAYSRHFPAVSPAARACIQTPLPEGVPLAVDVLFRPGAPRQVLHVQSISEWAPSCIGPYAQAVSSHGLVHFAGQIGLDPPTMTLVPGGSEAQAMRCLVSCQAVSIAAKTHLQHAMLGCTVYAASAASDRSTTAKADESQPDASRQDSGQETGGSCSSVTQTFRFAMQILTAFKENGLPQSSSSDRPHVPQSHGPITSQPSYSQRSHSSNEHSGLHSFLQAAAPEASPSKGVSTEQAVLGNGTEEYEEDSDQEEEQELVDQYLRPREAALTVPFPLLTYVEAASLPKGAAVELQPLALLSSSPDDLERGELGLRCSNTFNTSAIFQRGSMCYCHFSVTQAQLQAVPTVHISLLGDSVRLLLQEAELGMHTVESVRAYYSVSKSSREEACGLMGTLQDEMKVSWAPIFVPVISVGVTPAADAALLCVMLATEKACDSR